MDRADRSVLRHPRYLIGQTVWSGSGSFSTPPGSCAAPLILLAQTRQAERDKMLADADARHREDIAKGQVSRQEQPQHLTATLQHPLEQNTALTQRAQELTRQIQARVCTSGTRDSG